MTTARASTSAAVPMANDLIRSRWASVRVGKKSNPIAANAGTHTMPLRSSVGNCTVGVVACGIASSSVIQLSR